MWGYAALLVGVTVVAVGQLMRLRKHRHPELDPEVLAEREARRQAIVDDALARAGAAGAGLQVTHCTAYGWPHFTVHLPDADRLAALEASGDVAVIRRAFEAAVESAGAIPVEGSTFRSEEGVVFRVAEFGDEG